MNDVIYDLVKNYIQEKVTNELKDEFINAAIHFNINNTLYKSYTSLQIESKINKTISDELRDYIEVTSVYGYILFRLIKEGKFKEEDRIEGLQLIIEINNTITHFIRNIINEEELSNKLKGIIKKMNLKEEDNNEIISLLNS